MGYVKFLDALVLKNRFHLVIPTPRFSFGRKKIGIICPIHNVLSN